MTQSTEKLSPSHSEEHMLGHGFYNKHSHEQAKANTCGLPLVEYRSPSPFIRRENAVYVCANSAPVAQPDRATDF
jgi:hypothetical protein